MSSAGFQNSLENLIEYADQADKRLGISKTASSFQSKLARTLQQNFVGENSNAEMAEPEPERSRYRGEMWLVADLVKAKRPLIHCITNFVSMDIIANGLLAIGATPAMIHSPEELPQVISTLKQTNGILYINIGTLSEEWIRSFKTAVTAAAVHNIPWVLDPLAVGFTQLRSKTVKELLTIKSPAVIKGTKSEIVAMVKALTYDQRALNTEALDGPAGFSPNEASDAAVKLAAALNCVVCVSDEAKEIRTGNVVYQVSPGLFVTDGVTVLQIHHTSEMLGRIAAGRSLVSALICAFVAVKPDNISLVEVTAVAVAFAGIACQVASKESRGPGTFRVNLIDALHCCGETCRDVEVRISVRD